MKGWAESELQYAELGDVRRKKRLIRIVSDLAAQPNVSVPLFVGKLSCHPSRRVNFGNPLTLNRKRSQQLTNAAH